MKRRICVFCGSHPGRDDAYVRVAGDTARAIVAAGFGIVYGGGRVGLMGAVADAALAAGGEVIGIIPQALSQVEIAHPGLTQLHVVGSMHERKALMASSSVGFIALPGGFGTMDDKPIGLVNHTGYYDRLLQLFDGMVDQGFLSPNHRTLFADAPSIEELLTRMFP
jgi:uncharacterized protein (TIGR00730 family)